MNGRGNIEKTPVCCGSKKKNGTGASSPPNIVLLIHVLFKLQRLMIHSWQKFDKPFLILARFLGTSTIMNCLRLSIPASRGCRRAILVATRSNRRKQ
ncbi:hypothetical protein L6452_19575 [Arctium lappa]|uniref:Uncharacterized protein n=1 Tax=Arctium lappa TaxID=4217 RepID=A0ACB9B9R3_ARCLA|nr:hypothetical protein L6452_19575 [Arctium lappa]